MTLRSEDALRIVLGVLVISGFASSLTCPQNHYPYTCAACFTIPPSELDFNSSLAFCQNTNGTLITVENSTQMLTLGRYLEGLNETRILWIGYRYVMGSRVDVAGQAAPEVLQDSRNFVSGTTAGDTDTCIGVQEGRFVNVPCAERRPFICHFTYSVPALVSSSERAVYPAPAESITLTAQFQGVGISGVEWRHNGTRLRPQNGIMITVDGGFTQQATLTILQFNSSAHSGQYDIIVENPVGLTILAVWEVLPAVIGNFAAMPENLTIPRGQVAFFRCSVEGAQPRPLITWYKDLTALNTEGARFHVSDVTGTLFIRDVLESDAGLYHCTASNGAGTIRSSQAALTLTAPPQSDPQQQPQLPRILLQPADMTILRGNPYNLECVGLPTGGNTSQTTFLNDRNLAQGALRSFLYPDPPMGFPIFRIENVSFSDQSDCYHCQIRDETTRISFETRKATLTVDSEAQVNAISTTINSVRLANSLQPVPLGSNLTLQCQFGGVPIPSMVTWTVDGNATTMEGVRTAANTSTLEVTDFQRPGVYQCHVTNLYGTASGGVALCSTDTGRVPGPVLFRAEPNTNTSIFVDWNVPTDPNTHPLLLRYHVFLVGSPLRREESFGPFPAYQRDFVVTGLDPGVEYTVSVVASSLAGQGERPPANVTVAPFANPTMTPLTDITVQQTSDNTAHVLTWQLSNVSVGTVIRGYEIQFRNVDLSNITTVMVDMGERSLTVSGLNNAASYEARIRVVFQIQRAPPAYAPGPWSEWELAQGITTSPPNTTLTPSQVTLIPSSPPTGGVVGGTGTRTQGLFLVILLLPVAVLSIIVIVVVTVILVLQYRKHQKPRGSYSPSKVERRSIRARPMGSQVFNLPFNNQVADTLPEATDTLPETTDTLAYSSELTESLPYSSELTETVPYSSELNETVPYSSEVADTLPYSSELTKTVPYSSEVADTLHFSSEVADTLHFSSEVANTLPYREQLTDAQAFGSHDALPYNSKVADTLPYREQLTDALPYTNEVTDTLPHRGQPQAFGSHDPLPFRNHVTDTLPYGGQVANSLPFINEVNTTLPFGGQLTDTLPFRNQADNKAFGEQLRNLTPDPCIQPMCSQTHFGSQDTDIQALSNLMTPVTPDLSFEVFPGNPYLQQTLLVDRSPQELDTSFHKPSRT